MIPREKGKSAKKLCTKLLEKLRAQEKEKEEREEREEREAEKNKTKPWWRF